MESTVDAKLEERCGVDRKNGQGAHLPEQSLGSGNCVFALRRNPAYGACAASVRLSDTEPDLAWCTACVVNAKCEFWWHKKERAGLQILIYCDVGGFTSYMRI